MPSPSDDDILQIGDIRLDPGQTASNILRGPNGETVSRGSVQIRDSKNHREDTDTNEQGAFAMSGLHPGPEKINAGVTISTGPIPVSKALTIRGFNCLIKTFKSAKTARQCWTFSLPLSQDPKAINVDYKPLLNRFG